MGRWSCWRKILVVSWWMSVQLGSRLWNQNLQSLISSRFVDEVKWKRTWKLCWFFLSVIFSCLNTARKRSLGQGNIFTSVCPGGGEFDFPACITGHIQRGSASPHLEHCRIRSISGRYASYWNAFFFTKCFVQMSHIKFRENNFCKKLC